MGLTVFQNEATAIDGMTSKLAAIEGFLETLQVRNRFLGVTYLLASRDVLDRDIASNHSILKRHVFARLAVQFHGLQPPFDLGKLAQRHRSASCAYTQISQVR